jgi:peptidoglycan/xylan/chitin deacetylase (PgdA/CDA1 family)
VRADHAIDSLVSADPVVRTLLRLTRSRLRVFAYHGIGRLDVLDEHLTWIARHLEPVTAADVAAAATGGAALPDRAAWVTFDDGDTSMIDVARVVADHGMRATMFVNPGLMASRPQHWWRTVELGAAAGLVEDAAATTTRLKRVPDAERRAEVGALEQALDDGRAVVPTSLSAAQTRALATHHDIGNHTWDHPMLDRCTADEQRDQIVRAHAAIEELTGRPPRVFAYPNGASTPTAGRVLGELGYELAVVHDHRLADLRTPLAISRLRVGDHVSVDRLANIATGTHPAILRVTRPGLAAGAR